MPTSTNVTFVDTLDIEIRHRLAAVLEGAEPLDSFEEWLASATWDYDSELVVDLDHLFAERFDLTDDEVMSQLRRLASFVVEPSTRSAATGSSSETIHGSISVVQNVTIYGDLVAAGTRP